MNIQNLKALLNKGYEVVDITPFKNDGYISLELSYLDTPYRVDVPENKHLFLNLNEWEEVISSHLIEF